MPYKPHRAYKCLKSKLQIKFAFALDLFVSLHIKQIYHTFKLIT